MRELKFRGIDKNGNFVFGGFARKSITADGIIADFAIVPDGCYAIEVDPETIGQFTGLKNKIGIEVYEGDLIILPSWKSPQLVFWDKTGFLCYIPQLNKYSMAFLSGYGDFKIIGNIHQHKHLLEE